MGAIWGIIQKNPKKNKNTNYIEDLFIKMKTSMLIFPFDRIDTVKGTSGFFACGHQYFTQESINDVSPIYDENNNIIFCSDCFLYNREDLIKELDDKSLINAGDSQLVYMTFLKWGYSFIEKLRGIFSIAIYDETTSCLHLFSDHFAREYTVYNDNQDYICFSTTYKPVLACLGDKVKINREFIVNAYRDITPMNFYKENITPYENIFHLEYAMHLTFNLKTNNESRERYWNPIKNTKKLKLKTDDDYKDVFLKMFKKLTESMLRSKDETGILLSSGLDSSAVASLAAPILKKRGRKLYSYTSVPSTGYVDEEKNPDFIIDESSLVELQKSFHSNLETHYINGDNDCCLSDIDYYQNLYDMPIKSAINCINITNMIKAAKNDNCSILLTGENGNATISFGYLYSYMTMNIRHFHFIKAYKEINCFNKLYHISRKAICKKWLKAAYEYHFNKIEEKHYFLKSDDEKKYHLIHPLRDAIRQYGNSLYITDRHKKNFLVVPTQFLQKAFYHTTNGLKNHFIQLDPTLTVEMIEFCLSIPRECFVHNGIERRLARYYMKDLMPNPITNMFKGFGAQALDFCYRANRDFDKHKDFVFRNLDEPLLKEYLDPGKIDHIIEEVKKSALSHKLEKESCIKMTFLAYLGSFLRDHTK
ncbi:MAG: hypothetical protein IKN95_00995 [Lachnospiraceae bacterium]|nr:hypothetical protein [Lachnospiraceae bacterium]